MEIRDLARRARRGSRDAAGDPRARPAPGGRALAGAGRLAGDPPPPRRRDRPARLPARAAAPPEPAPPRLGPSSDAPRGGVRRARRRGDAPRRGGRLAADEARGDRARRVCGARLRLHPRAAPRGERPLPLVGRPAEPARRRRARPGPADPRRWPADLRRWPARPRPAPARPRPHRLAPPGTGCSPPGAHARSARGRCWRETPCAWTSHPRTSTTPTSCGRWSGRSPASPGAGWPSPTTSWRRRRSRPRTPRLPAS